MEYDNKDFYTARGYTILNQNDKTLTDSMEDYLEMTYRLSHDKGFTRISDLASALNVQPPSASKMVNKLAEMNFLVYEKYGVIQLNEQGIDLGQYLLKRHDTIEQFLRLIDVSDNILEQTENIEHSITEDTLQKINKLILFFQENTQILELYRKYSQNF